MVAGKLDSLKIGRRTALKLAAGAGLAATSGLRVTRAAHAADTTLSIWTGYPELTPYYEAVAEAYKATHPGVSVTVFSTSLREAEQKLSAAVPTGTGPDIFDIGTNITVNFIEAGLIEPNDRGDRPVSPEQGLVSHSSSTSSRPTARATAYRCSSVRRPSTTTRRCSRRPGSPAPPATFPEMVDAARKMTKLDGSGRMTRSGISLRLSGQGSGIAEKFRFVLEPAGGSLIVKTPSGKWHNGSTTRPAGRRCNSTSTACRKTKSTTPGSSTTPQPSSPAPPPCCSARPG